MPLFQIQYDLRRTDECPPGRYGFCVTEHYVTTERERFDNEAAAVARFEDLRAKRRTPEGEVLTLHLECHKQGLLGGFWKRLRTSEIIVVTDDAA